MKLAELVDEVATVLAAQTGLPASASGAPSAGEPQTSDYPYLIVDLISDTTDNEIGSFPPGSGRATFQISAVGLTRLQAAKAADRARGLLDPTVAVATSDTAWSGARWLEMSTFQRDGSGELATAVLRIGVVIVAL